ncbi:MAG TPA: sigma-54 dependent transcriptional regulator, partial [Sandaracinaceae bacterium]
GKELIARAVHHGSPRAAAPFIAVNCVAIPAELAESMLFGHLRGSFTGAVADRKGCFELADGGTLFLDEIGDMSLSAQAKVLRALQSGEITRVGGERPVAVDVRVIAATNKDLERLVAEGQFREDLYFRLNVVPLRSPPLRERREDIPALATTFLREFCEENGLKPKPIDPAVLERLRNKPWPGNVRELKNVVERMAILSGDRITLDDLPPEGRLAQAAAAEVGPDGLPDGAFENGRRLTLREYRDRAERRYIRATLEECDWNISKAAALLGVERTNLHKKMRALGLRRDGQAD